MVANPTVSSDLRRVKAAQRESGRDFVGGDHQLGASIALRNHRMKTAKANQLTSLNQALHALKQAILEGSTWRYEQLVTAAVQAGASDEQIDLVAHEAVAALFAQAEKPVTPRNLGYVWSPGYSRH